mmetsp:Transcript_27980/g.68337  ORF Transcript_27980/g.68337 Transcript_27980/m.68337 type:complete len:271 (+) Transcript_27980:12574-13386(+)
MVSIILTLFIRAGRPSMMLSGVPEYRGSVYFSSVDRYLTLSLASLSASVMPLSQFFHLLSTLLFDVVSTAITTRACGFLSCSATLLNLAMRVRQYSNSVSGPESSASLGAACFSSRSTSVCDDHFSTMVSKWDTTSESTAALANALWVGAMRSYFSSGIWSSIPPLRLCTASVSRSVNLPIYVRKCDTLSSLHLPQFSCASRAGFRHSSMTSWKLFNALPMISPYRMSVSTLFTSTPFGLMRVKNMHLPVSASSRPVLNCSLALLDPVAS